MRLPARVYVGIGPGLMVCFMKKADLKTLSKKDRARIKRVKVYEPVRVKRRRRRPSKEEIRHRLATNEYPSGGH